MVVKIKNKTFLDSLKCAFKGLVNGFKREKNFKIYLLNVLITVPINFIVGFSLLQHIIYFIIVGGVFASEYINTAIEIICDSFTTEYNTNIKNIKDIAAAAVLCWGLLFYTIEIGLVIHNIVI